jgi:uncharacterized protein YqeY
MILRQVRVLRPLLCNLHPKSPFFVCIRTSSSSIHPPREPSLQDPVKREGTPREPSQQDVSLQEFSNQFASDQEVLNEEVLNETFSNEDLPNQELSNNELSNLERYNFELSNQKLVAHEGDQELSNHELPNPEPAKEKPPNHEHFNREFFNQQLPNRELSYHEVFQQDLANHGLSNTEPSNQDLSNCELPNHELITEDPAYPELPNSQRLRSPPTLPNLTSRNDLETAIKSCDTVTQLILQSVFLPYHAALQEYLGSQSPLSPQQVAHDNFFAPFVHRQILAREALHALYTRYHRHDLAATVAEEVLLLREYVRQPQTTEWEVREWTLDAWREMRRLGRGPNDPGDISPVRILKWMRRDRDKRIRLNPMFVYGKTVMRVVCETVAEVSCRVDSAVRDNVEWARQEEEKSWRAEQS